jgi:hypothetical protein
MSDKDRKERLMKLFGEKRFDVENALNMYATSFITLPASAIYDDHILDAFRDQIRKCHIYFIGLIPKIDLVDCRQEERELITSCQVDDKTHDLRWSLPPEVNLEGSGESKWYLANSAGKRSFPSEEKIIARLNSEVGLEFEVLYIGQAFGENGSRNALDRLRKHETLQKISLKGIPSGSVLTVLLFEVVPNPRMIMMFNPFAKDVTQGDDRIEKGLSKLAETSDAEKTTLYEASLIRYFAPRFNTEFKDSFPSTNMKLLKGCYDKDIAAVSAEIVIDELPFRLRSETVSASYHHIAHHDLHTAQDRKVFFFGTVPGT